MFFYFFFGVQTLLTRILHTKFSLILEKIGFHLVSGFLRSTVVGGDCCFNNLCGSHLQSQVRHSWAQTIFRSKVLTVL